MPYQPEQKAANGLIIPEVNITEQMQPYDAAQFFGELWKSNGAYSKDIVVPRPNAGSVAVLRVVQRPTQGYGRGVADAYTILTPPETTGGFTNWLTVTRSSPPPTGYPDYRGNITVDSVLADTTLDVRMLHEDDELFDYTKQEMLDREVLSTIMQETVTLLSDSH